jgi:hypothetical protein
MIYTILGSLYANSVLLPFHILFGVLFLLYSPGKISKASDTTYLIEFSRKALNLNSKSYQSLSDSVKEVLGIIVNLLKDRACAENEPDRKRVRIEGYRLKK